MIIPGPETQGGELPCEGCPHTHEHARTRTNTHAHARARTCTHTGSAATSCLPPPPPSFPPFFLLIMDSRILNFWTCHARAHGQSDTLSLNKCTYAHAHTYTHTGSAATVRLIPAYKLQVSVSSLLQTPRSPATPIPSEGSLTTPMPQRGLRQLLFPTLCILRPKS